MDKYDQGIGTATDLLTYYLRTAWEAAGLSWDRDNDTEIGAIIEAISATIHSPPDEVSADIATEGHHHHNPEA